MFPAGRAGIESKDERLTSARFEDSPGHCELCFADIRGLCPANAVILWERITALLTLVCLLIALMALNVNVDQLEQIGLGPLSAKLRAKIVPNWHDAKRLRVPFSRSWKQ
jgi:hypothetical protein